MQLRFVHYNTQMLVYIQVASAQIQTNAAVTLVGF